MRLYDEIIPSFSEGIIDRTGAYTMLNLTSTTITSVDLAHYGVSCARDWVSVDCGTRFITNSGSCTTTELSKLLTSYLSAVKTHVIR